MSDRSGLSRGDRTLRLIEGDSNLIGCGLFEHRRRRLMAMANLHAHPTRLPQFIESD